jgi:hypothetical protein
LERDFYRRRLTRQKGPEDDVSAQGPENGDHHAREMAAKSGLSARELSVAGFGRLGGGGCSPAKPVSRNREFFEIFRPEQASDALMAADRSNFGRNPNQLRKSYGTLLLLCKTG